MISICGHMTAKAHIPNGWAAHEILYKYPNALYYLNMRRAPILEMSLMRMIEIWSLSEDRSVLVLVSTKDASSTFPGIPNYA